MDTTNLYRLQSTRKDLLARVEARHENQSAAFRFDLCMSLARATQVAFSDRFFAYDVFIRQVPDLLLITFSPDIPDARRLRLLRALLDELDESADGLAFSGTAHLFCLRLIDALENRPGWLRRCADDLLLFVEQIPYADRCLDIEAEVSQIVWLIDVINVPQDSGG